MVNTPTVIFNIEAHQQSDSKRDFYTCKQDYDVLNYFSRKQAVDKSDKAFLKEISDHTTLSDHDILNYMGERTGSTGLFTNYGEMTKAQVKEIREKLRNTESCIWSSVISFESFFGNKFCASQKDALAIINSTFNQFLTEAKLDPTNITWIAAFHTNTDNPHIHLTFFENQPIHLNEHGKKSYSYWRLPKNAINRYSQKISLFLNKNKIDYFHLRDELRTIMKNNFSSKDFFDRTFELNKALAQEPHSWQYGRLSSKNKKLINSFLDSIIESNKEAFKIFQEYSTKLLKTQQEYINNFKNVNKTPSDEAMNFYQNRIDELYSRLGNDLLTNLKPLMEETNFLQKNNLIEECYNNLLSKKFDYLIENETNHHFISLIKQNGWSSNPGQQYDNQYEELSEASKHSYNKNAMSFLKNNNQTLDENDKDLLNKFGISFICTKVNSIKIKDFVLCGEFYNLTFISKEKRIEEYVIPVNEGKVKSLSNVFKKLGLDNNQILSICSKTNKDSLLFKLLTETGRFRIESFDKPDAKEYDKFPNRINSNSYNSYKKFCNGNSRAMLTHKSPFIKNYIKILQSCIVSLLGDLSEDQYFGFHKKNHNNDDEDKFNFREESDYGKK